MGSSRACAPEKPFVAAFSLPSYNRDMKLFGGQKGSVLSSSADRSEGMLADLGLTLTSSTMETKASSIFTHANPAEIKVLKRPEGGALPCPRCNSLDTKFCYYNNYNINQPRHFCKGCQRYWTAGGTLRNVAIGAGRRKRKHASHESGSQDCMLEDLSSMEVLASIDSGTGKGKVPHGRPQLVKPQVLPIDRIPYPTFSNSSSLTLNESSLSEGSQHQTWINRPHDKVEPLFNCHDFKERMTTVYEYLLFPEAPPDKGRMTVNAASNERACDGLSMEQMQTQTLGLHMDSQHSGRRDVECRLVSSTSSDRQASNESGCTSSVTTQAFTADTCVVDRKHDAFDSEVTKEVDKLEKGGSFCNKLFHSARLLPSRMSIGGGASAISDFAQYRAPNPGTVAPTKEQMESAAAKAPWPVISPAVTWCPPVADRATMWEFPWGGPTADAVDAAKAAMIPGTGLSLKRQPEPHHPSEKRIWVPKTLRITDADEAARSSIWLTLGITDRQGSVLSKKVDPVFPCQENVRGTTAAQSQHINPAAMTKSTSFQETG